MNLILKLGIVPIFFFPLIAGWAGTQEEAKVVEQPSEKTTEPWQITVGGPGWLAGLSGTNVVTGILFVDGEEQTQQAASKAESPSLLFVGFEANFHVSVLFSRGLF